MEFALTPKQGALRDEVREFLQQALLPESERDLEDTWMVGFSKEFSAALGARGWIGYTWPRRYSGQEGSYLERLIITEELLRAGAPVAAHWAGDRQIGPALLAYGNDEQREEFLPRIVRGALVFCLGMSEPNAGSDLAALKTHAVEDGDFYVIDGHKIWTSFAHQADYCYLVARTDPQAPKHRGISEFLIDMRTPGITVTPIVDMAGEHHFNETFFEGVRIHKRYLIGQKNRGWYQMASQLDYERSGIERLLSNCSLLRDIAALARTEGLTADPIWRDRLAQGTHRATDRSLARLPGSLAIEQRHRAQHRGGAGQDLLYRGGAADRGACRRVARNARAALTRVARRPLARPGRACAAVRARVHHPGRHLEHLAQHHRHARLGLAIGRVKLDTIRDFRR